MSEMFEYKTTCFKCGTELTFVTEEENWDEPFEQEGWDEETGDYTNVWETVTNKVACPPCARKMGDNSLHWCSVCSAVYQSFSIWTEGCSPECCDRVDELVEKAHQAELDREQRWLESYGEDAYSDQEASL